MDLSLFEQGIKKTGFDLEFRISKILQDNNWTVINNRYYIDDHQETVREIDIIAYKASQLEDFLLLTTLVVSCKKSEENAWVLLSKNRDAQDPNVEWKPMHVWTNNKALNFTLASPS